VRFFVYEYANARADATLPKSIRREGEAMLRAVTGDLGRIEGAQVWTLPSSSDESAFRRLAREADFSLIIAPEFGDILYERCCWIEEEHGRLLGPSSRAVALTGDKWALCEHLRLRGVQTPVCHAINEMPPQFPLVCKPRFGAGSQATFRIDRSGALPDCLAVARAEGWQGEMMLQPFVAGTAASVSFLCGSNACVPLAPTTQILSNDGRFHYHGGELPLPPPLAERAVGVALSAINTVPGLLGYVGVDVVLGDAGDCVIEINPRLTTSYLGLRALAEDNLAEMMVRVVLGENVKAPRWRDEIVRF
jgi:predicted ATP-grasp superfamily ATP-dependent carboligase